MNADLSRFERQYRTRHAPEWHLDPCDRAWLTEIPCSKAKGGGHLFTIGEDSIGYMGRQPCRKHELLRIPGVTMAQEGDQEFTTRFPVELLDQVAKVVGALRRVRLSPEEKAARSARAAGLAKLRNNVTAHVLGPATPSATPNLG
jgi:hypothetical protein